MTLQPDHHPDPGGEAAARAAQLAAMLVSVAEAVARLRAQRLATAEAVAEQAASAARADRLARDAAARVVYGAALDDPWRRQASTSELLDSWAAAGPYLDGDPLARLASDRVEERLRQLHPEAMAAYDAARTGGFLRQDCLDVAASLWRGEYGLDPIGTRVARNLAEDALRWAAADRATPDLPATHAIDEHETGLATSMRHQGQADAFAARALPAGPRDVIGETFPIDIQTAMATAPRAANARLALTASPQHLQLTAAPHTPRSTR